MPSFAVREAIATAAKKRRLSSAQKIKAKATTYVVFTCFVSAMSGALFGFDGGITGGVSTMSAFQSQFFPEQLKRDSAGESYYCKYNDQILQLFATSMYFTGAIASIPGSMLSQKFGRTFTMTLAGCSFLIGSGIQAGAPRVINLILGRIFLGVGVGFADQASTIYSSEMSPPHLRGSLTMLFQLCVVTGILIAQAINVGTAQITWWGWRLSLGLSAVPGFVLFVGGLLLPETPNSLIERGYLQKGRAVLEAIRGTADVDDEYGTIVYAQRREKAEGKNQFRSIIRKDLRPHLIMSIALPFFQQWTGINAVVFFSPLLFQGLGPKFSGTTGALLASVIVGAVQVFGTLIGIFVVDKVGRRKILIQSSIQTFIAEIALGIVFAYSVDTNTVTLASTPSIASISLICMFVVAFGWGWGPLAWILTSEIHPLETRSVSQGLTVFTQLLSGGIVGQSFLTALCSMEYGVYIFFGLVQLTAALFVYFLLPETAGVPIEMVSEVFRGHWYWKRYMPESSEGDAAEAELANILARRSKEPGAMGEPRSSGRLDSLDSYTGRRSIYDSSRSMMRFAESSDPIPEVQEDGDTVGQPGQSQPAASVEVELRRLSGGRDQQLATSDPQRPSESPFQRHDSLGEGPSGLHHESHQENPQGADMPHLQPSPFEDVPASFQMWQGLPAQDDVWKSGYFPRVASGDERHFREKFN